MYAEHCIISHTDFAKLAESYNPWTVLGVSNRYYGVCTCTYTAVHVWSILYIVL